MRVPERCCIVHSKPSYGPPAGSDRCRCMARPRSCTRTGTAGVGGVSGLGLDLIRCRRGCSHVRHGLGAPGMSWGGGDSAGPRTPTTPPPPRGLRPALSWGGGGVVGVQNREVAPPPPPGGICISFLSDACHMSSGPKFCTICAMRPLPSLSGLWRCIGLPRCGLVFRSCLSYSRRRGRLDLGFLWGLDKGGGEAGISTAVLVYYHC